MKNLLQFFCNGGYVNLTKHLSVFQSKKIYLLTLLIISFTEIGLTTKLFNFDECQINPNKPAFVGTPVTFSITCPQGEPGFLIAWDFGDGTGLGPYTTQTTVTHTYNTTGTFAVFARKQGDDIPLFVDQTIIEPITDTRPTHSSTIVHDTTNAIVWAVNPDNNSVTTINSITLAKIFEKTVGVHPRTVAVDKNGNGWIVNEDDATISVVSKTGTLVKNISLQHASRPYGVCFDPQGNNVFVTLSGTGKLVKINPATGTVTGEISIGPSPRGIAVSSDGKRVFVTRFISAVDHGEITEVNPTTMTIARVIPLAFDNTPDFEDKGRGVPNYISSITISPTGKLAWIPSKKDNVARGKYRDGLALTFESTVRTIASKINLVNNTEDLPSRIDINDADMANAVEFSPYGNIAFIALQGTNKVQVRDVATNALITNIDGTGLAPQGLVFTKDGNKLFVQNFMSRTVRVYNTEGLILGNNATPTVLATINTVTTELLSPEVLKGKQIFYNAEDKRMTFAGYISCASCHLDGGSDQRVWDFTDRGEGFRKTISLNGKKGTEFGNVHWTGNFDEIQDFENDIRNFFKGSGFMTDADFNATADPLGEKKAGKSVDLDALAAYVASLTKVHPSPFKNSDGTLTAEALAGKAIFIQAECGSCHSGPNFTDRKTGTLHDVGTLKASSGTRINQPLTGLLTPTLKGLWENAPYLHDGSATTLHDVITKNTGDKHGKTSSLTSTQVTQLIAYLKQLDDLNPTTDSLPAAPATITLKEENSKISLSWSSVAQATKYNVKRSTSATGPFTTTGTSTTTTYIDQTVTNGTTYYYVVSAVNTSGEGPNSSVVQGVPQLYITDLTWVSATNGYGPVEKDRSNGEAGSTDGTTITIDGQQYSRGLGVHANSTVVYNLNQEYGRFVSAVGIDDEVGTSGSCIFEVYLDGVRKFTSGKVTGNDAKKIVDLNVSGVKELRLVVTHAGDGNSYDHASWGGPYLVRTISAVVATVYKHCNYSTTGYAVGLQPGNYTLAQLQAKGILNNDISSVKIQSGYEMVLYNDNNFLGTSRVVRADNPCLTSIQFNDVTSSLKICAITANARVADFFDENEDEISVFPNPTSNSIKILTKGITKVNIYNVSGIRVIDGARLGADGLLSIEKLPSGVYIVELQQENNRIIHRARIEKQ
jgi:YVTN family beta-propeller protein